MKPAESEETFSNGWLTRKHTHTHLTAWPFLRIITIPESCQTTIKEPEIRERGGKRAEGDDIPALRVAFHIYPYQGCPLPRSPYLGGSVARLHARGEKPYINIKVTEACSKAMSNKSQIVLPWLHELYADPLWNLLSLLQPHISRWRIYALMLWALHVKQDILDFIIIYWIPIKKYFPHYNPVYQGDRDVHWGYEHCKSGSRPLT